MRIKSVSGFTMLILLFGVATGALQNSAFATDYTTNTADNPKENNEKIRDETVRSICNPADVANARKELAALEQRYSEMKKKYYEEWQRLHESGEYDGSWEKFAREHFLNSTELSEMKNIREKYSEFFRHCNDAREIRPSQVSPNDVREVRPYAVSPTNTQRISCNENDYLHAKNELAALEQRYGDYKEKYYQEWQRMHESGEYDGSWENFAKEHFMNSPDMVEARQIHEKYSVFLRHCNQVTDARPHAAELTASRTVCKEDYEHARKELAALEGRYGELKMKFYNEWQRLHESGEYDGSWEKFAEEKFLNSSEIADLNHKREKYHQLMMRCSNAQHGITEQDNYEEETTSDNDLTDELEDEIALDNDVTDYLDEETILDDDLDELLTEIESISVPESIKDEAGWWADNQIEDSDFASSIEYLASQNVMQLAGQSGPDSHIPQWVKAIAGWWAEGKIPDKEFVNAVQFLVNHGIIKV